jgi:L-threonylcarbamoyladenylate synthase
LTALLHNADRDIIRAAEMLARGNLVAFGTETVYGLGADAQNPTAVAKIFEAKGRPHFNPLICHYLTAEAAFAHVHPTPAAEQLASTFWPGPLTLVLPRRVTCPVALLAGAGLETLAIRVPTPSPSACSPPSAGPSPPPPPTAPAASVPPPPPTSWPSWKAASPPSSTPVPAASASNPPCWT